MDCMNGAESRSNEIVNYIIILMKQYIFNTKQINTIPTFNMFEIRSKKRIKLEKEIALFKDQLEMHDNKWKKILDL